MRIMLGLHEISNVLQNLKKGFDTLGISSDIVLTKDYAFGVDTDLIAKHWSISLAKYAILLHRRNKEVFLIRHILAFFSLIGRTILFVRCLTLYDTFIFVAFSSFFNFKELIILKFFKKKVIYFILGSDFRPPYLDGSHFQKNLDEIHRLTIETKDRVKIIEQYASYIISYTAVSHFQTLPYIDYRYFGIPTDYHYIQLKSIPQPYLKKGKIKIVHAPTNRVAKGTSIITQTIESLKERYDIEFVLLSNMNNQEVLYHIATSDFVIDQLYSGGGYMARFSTEAAFFKKPSIVTGYDMSNFYENFKYQEKIPPIVYGVPEDLEKLILHLIGDEQYRIEIGEKAYNFVIREWNPIVIANKFKNLIDDNIPQEWWYNPLQNKTLWYYGRNRLEARQILREYIAKFGENALYMEHNQQIKQVILKFAMCP